MIVPGCNQKYRHPTIAVHLHEYEATVWIKKCRYEIKPGDVTLSPPDTISRYLMEDSGTHLCLHLSAPSSKKREVIELPLHFSLGTQAPAARDRLWRIIDYVRMAGSGSPASVAASALLQEFLIWVYLQSRQSSAPRVSREADEALRKVLQTIDGALDQNRLLSEWTAGAGLSAEHLSRLFTKRYGMRLQRYILLKRIEVARHLMASTDFRISEIAGRVGLSDPQYFNKQFRRVVGESPLAYRHRLHRSMDRK